MAHFYGALLGNRGEATRLGTKLSGLSAQAQGWHVGARLEACFNNGEQSDEIRVYGTTGSSGVESVYLGAVKIVEGKITFSAAEGQ